MNHVLALQTLSCPPRPNDLTDSLAEEHFLMSSASGICPTGLAAEPANLGQV